MILRNQLKKQVKEMNQTCDDNKLPFKIKVFKLNKSQLMNKLMTTMPAELFDWDDEVIQQRAETLAWNDSFGGDVWR